jgi:hypothetical protein
MSGELKEIIMDIMEMTPASLKELERLATKAENEATRLGAIKEILDRGYGRPGQQVNLDMSLSTVHAMRASLWRARSPSAGKREADAVKRNERRVRIEGIDEVLRALDTLPTRCQPAARAAIGRWHGESPSAFGGYG